VTIKAGSALRLRLRGIDLDGDALAYTMSAAPGGLALSGAGMLTWARPARGSYPLKVTVTDSNGLASPAATITLDVAG
jgi:hypothetical protein